MADSSLITLVLFQGSGSIWSLNDWKKARKHKIIGNFIGNLSQLPYQVKEKGFPLILTKNETTILIENNLAVLLTSRKVLDCPDVEVGHCHNKKRNDSFLRQSALMQKERKDEILSRSELIITGKLRKRQKVNAEYVMCEEERASIIQDEIAKISDPSQSYMFIEISTVDPWLKDKTWKRCEWTYPQSEAEQLEYATFRSLWEKNLWVTPGAKFGGNFLAYYGDPLKFHSSYIVRCTKRDKVVELLDIITLSRLATSTNKVPVFAYFDANRKIKLESISWVH